MEYILSEQELKDLMHRSWLKAKRFYKGQTDEYFYDHFESEKKQLTIHSVVKSLKDKEAVTFEDFMTNFCKHGITLTQNYTGETIGLKDLIHKYKLTNDKNL